VTHHPCPVEHCDRPRRGDQHICDACQGDIVRALQSVPELAGQLDVEMAGLKPRTGPAARPATPPLPYNPRASEAGSILRSALVGWVRELHDGDEPWPADTLADMAVWILARQRRLWRHPAVDEAHGEITTAVGEVMRVVDLPPQRQYAGRCAQCARPLYARPAAETVTCQQCDTVHDVVEQRRALLDQLADRLATAAEIAHALTGLMGGQEVTPERVRQWAHRGHILPRGVNRSGRKLYRIGDAIKHLGALGDREPELSNI